MFIVLQMPFVDLRGLSADAQGRSPRPNWRANDPGQAFIRGFGQLSTRNADAYGLMGERAYVEFEHALAFPTPGQYRQEGWPRPIPMRLWFRRLYFDGEISGRLEIGFNSHYEAEEQVVGPDKDAYDLPQLARTICDIPVEVRSVDGTRTPSALEHCGNALGLAYVNATTLHSTRNTYPAHELLGSSFKIGSPSIHVRAPDKTPIVASNDRRDIVVADQDHLFLTSIAKAQRRNTLSVQISPGWSETPIERARRVLFSHLNAVLYANDFLTHTMDPKDIVEHRLTLRDLTERAIKRFEKLAVTAPKTDDEDAFTAALLVFAKANAGRIDELVEKLEGMHDKAGAPSRLEKIGTWVRGWTEFVTNAAVQASVESMMKVK